MGRTQKLDTVLYPSGTPVEGASVAVKIVNADGSQGADATIFISETGVTAANPLSTGPDGVFEIWANTGARYDIIISAAGFVTRTLRWDNAYFPPADRAIGPVQLGVDVLPIGTGIDWWRPTAAVPLPTGWAICDGRTLTALQHNFPGGGSITLPDMRNSFALGANSTITDGTAATAGDAAANSPGIGGSGASHARNLAHTHTINPASVASGAASSSTTSNSGAGTSGGSGTLTTSSDGSGNTGGSGPLITNNPDSTHASDISGNDFAAGKTHQHGINSHDHTMPNHNHTVASHTHSVPNHTHTMPHTHQVDIAQSTSTSQLSATQDIKPQYVGWLRIIKVKNT